MAAHAKLSASGSKRWLSCTPSANLEATLPESQSAFADEGTFAHTIAELMLRHELGEITTKAYNGLIKKAGSDQYYSQELIDYVEQYSVSVLEKAAEARDRSEDALVLLEQRLDFSRWVPEGFGTGDVVIISDGILEIIDLKYGKGVPVDANENTQMMLYGLGAWNTYHQLYDIDLVRMTILQPRLDSISTYELTLKALLEWAEGYLKPRAEMAAKGEGEFCAGEHCRFCRAKAICRARAEANLEMAKYEFAPGPTLSADEVADILQKAEDLKAWASDITTYALDQAERHGVKYPGWKLVEGRSNRKYTDEEAVAAKLLGIGYPEETIYTRSLLGITAMEKAIGKKLFTESLADLVIKPSGKPTLVPEADKRPELNTTASAVADFS